MRIAPVVLAVGPPFPPITGALPRAYLRVGGRRLYQHAADALAQAFGRAYVVAPQPDGRHHHVEDPGGGLEAALAQAEAHLPPGDTHLLLAHGDVYVEPSAYRALVEAAAEAGADGAVLAVAVQRARGYWPLRLGPGGALAGMGGDGQLVYGGAALLPRQAARLAAEMPLQRALEEAARRWRIAVLPWGGLWQDVLYLEDVMRLLEALAPRRSEIAATARISPTAVVEGPVVVEDGAEVDHYAVVKGPAYIGRGAFVGTHSLVRNHAYIEAEAVVGSSAEVSHSLVGERAVVGRASFISYSLVGEEAVVEPNVVTMSVLREGRDRLEPISVRGRQYYKLGAVIPRGTRVPAGTVTRPGQGY